MSGYNDLPRRAMYWEQSSRHNEAISSAMSRQRFDELLRFLHVADNLNLTPGDKFAKVRPLYSMLNELCLLYWSPEQNLSIEESMVLYFGKNSAKQFIRCKPVIFGYKIWSLNTATGYAIQFEPYGGVSDNSQVKAEFGLGRSVIHDLLSELPMTYSIIVITFLPQ